MARCPNCDATLAGASDVEFVEKDARLGFLRSSKRFYVVDCADCGTTLGGGVAGAQANASGGAAAAGGH